MIIESRSMIRLLEGQGSNFVHGTKPISYGRSICNTLNPLSTLLRDGVVKFHFFSIISKPSLEGTIVFCSSRDFQQLSPCSKSSFGSKVMAFQRSWSSLAKCHLPTTWFPSSCVIRRGTCQSTLLGLLINGFHLILESLSLSRFYSRGASTPQH
jgi:hypothetical protein